MLNRLEDSVIRGELDCRERGRVTGKLWLLGRSDPVELDLRGVPSPDMAGVHFRFRCEYPPSERAPSLPTPQTGHLLACCGTSRKRIPEGAEQEIHLRIRKRIDHTWIERTVLHVEWIDSRGYRVVLESAGLKVEVIEPAAWRLTAAEEREAEATRKRLRAQWLETQSPDRLLLPELQEENVARSRVEQEADREHEKMERLNDRIQARLDKLDAFSEEEYERIYQEERENIRIEFGEPEPEPLTPWQEKDHARWIEEMNRISEEALQEWEAGEDIEPERHPLLVQCDQLQEKVTADLRDSGWMPDAPGEEHPYREVTWGLHMATAKLAGGMGMVGAKEWPPNDIIAGSVLVYLKLVRGYLRDVLTALDCADEENLGTSAWRKAVRLETGDLLHETELLIFELRERLS